MISQRALKPYPPAGVTLTDTSTPTPSGQIAITWKNRNRLTSGIKKQSAAGDALEENQSHTINVHLTSTMALLHSETGLTGESFNYTAADELADTGLMVLSDLTIKIKSVRDGFESAEQVFTVDRP